MAARRRTEPLDPTRAVGYVRVSTDEQALGPEAQRDALAAWCDANGATLVACFEDHGVSGTTPLDRRPALNEALDALATERAGVLLVAKRDRLARDVVVGAVIERLVERQGARVLAADGTGNGEGPEHQLMRHLVNAFAEYEALVIAARTRAALAVKKARGERVGSVPYGFRVTDDGILEPDDDEQEMVAVARRLRERGLSLRAIDRELRARGHLPRNGRAWHVNSLATIVRG
jgi:DNA invertase Pin-like site-specific DNA recombinase